MGYRRWGSDVRCHCSRFGFRPIVNGIYTKVLRSITLLSVILLMVILLSVMMLNVALLRETLLPRASVLRPNGRMERSWTRLPHVPHCRSRGNGRVRRRRIWRRGDGRITTYRQVCPE
jgi:hypothetical protein